MSWVEESQTGPESNNPKWDDYVNKRGRWAPKEGPVEPERCHWCHEHCGGTCLGVNHPGGPRQMKSSGWGDGGGPDPAYWMLKDGFTTTKEVHRDGCEICSDPEFAAMGLPLCKSCPQCSEKAGENAGHVPADDEECDDCGYNLREHYEREREAKDAG